MSARKLAYLIDVGDFETAENYLEQCDEKRLNIAHLTGVTVLHKAARKGNSKLIIKLVKAGADPARECSDSKIPLQYYLHDNHNSDSEAILPLIPQHNMDPFVMVDYIRLCRTHDAEVLARMLLSTRPEDYFSLHGLTGISYWPTELFFLTPKKYKWARSGYYLNNHQLSSICVLVRKGLGAQTSPQCSDLLSHYRGKGHLYPLTSTVEESNAKYEEAAEKMKEIDALFDGCLSLFDQCRITIRRSIQTPKYDKLRLLPIPPLVLDQVTFLSQCKEICESIQNRR